MILYLKGLDCCSDSSISFHYMFETETRKLYSILKNAANNKFDKNNVTFEYIVNEMLKKD